MFGRSKTGRGLVEIMAELNTEVNLRLQYFLDQCIVNTSVLVCASF